MFNLKGFFEMTLAKSALLLLILSSSQVSTAGLPECQEAADRGPKLCERVFNTNSDQANAADLAMQQKAAAGGPSGWQGAADLNSAAQANVGLWSTVVSVCQEKQDECEQQCPQGQSAQVDNLRNNCKIRTSKYLNAANAALAQNAQGVAGSAASGNEANMAGAETLEGNVHQTSVIGSYHVGKDGTVTIPSGHSSGNYGVQRPGAGGPTMHINNGVATVPSYSSRIPFQGK